MCPDWNPSRTLTVVAIFSPRALFVTVLLTVRIAGHADLTLEGTSAAAPVAVVVLDSKALTIGSGAAEQKHQKSHSE